MVSITPGKICEILIFRDTPLFGSDASLAGASELLELLPSLHHNLPRLFHSVFSYPMGFLFPRFLLALSTLSFYEAVMVAGLAFGRLEIILPGQANWELYVLYHAKGACRACHARQGGNR
jgi:hypothetical protein